MRECWFQTKSCVKQKKVPARTEPTINWQELRNDTVLGMDVTCRSNRRAARPPGLRGTLRAAGGSACAAGVAGQVWQVVEECRRRSVKWRGNALVCGAANLRGMRWW